MKARIVDIKRFAVHDGPGIRTTVFFKGCPLKCVWCHNPESINLNPQMAFYRHKCTLCGLCEKVCQYGAHTIKDGKHFFELSRCVGSRECERICPNNALKYYGAEMTVEELLHILIEDKDFYDNSNGGVTLSGGECLLFPQFCRELLKQLKMKDIHTAVDTCGFVSQKAIEQVMAYTDIFLYDIKAYDEDCHIRFTGQSNKIIFENLQYLDNQNKKIEIRIPYVPNYNDNQMEKIAKFLKKFKNIVRVKVLAYHNYAGSKYEALNMENTLPKEVPTGEQIAKAQQLFERTKSNKLKSPI